MEQDLLQAAQCGDSEAINWLVEQYQRPVYFLCYRMLGEQTEAEDAAQEALVKAIMHLDSFELGRPFKPWVLRIASNECLDRLRRRKPVVSLDSMGEDGAWEWRAGHSPNPESEIMDLERQEKVRNILDTLQPVDRNIVVLFYWQGYSYTEIADATGLSVPAIKSRLFRARRAMAEELAPTMAAA